MKAITPKPADKKMKIFMYSSTGLGKTMAALQFPNALIIDMERGTDMYTDLIIAKNSKVLKTSNHKEINEEIDDLIKNKNKYGFKTLIIDPITIYYNSLQEEWHDKFTIAEIKKSKEDTLEDFGIRFWQKVKPKYKGFLTKIINLDMHVIVTAHEKDKYKGQSIIGVTYASEKSDGHMFDFVFRFVKEQGKFIAITEKQRILPGKEFRFPDKFEWNYKNLIKFVNHDLSVDNVEYEENNKTQEELNKIYPSQTHTKTLKTEEDIPKTNKINNKKLKDIIKTLSKEKITKENFTNFLITIVKWKDINNVNDLTDKQINIIWKNLPKIIDKYKTTNKENIQEETNQDSLIILIKKELNENIKATGITYDQFVNFLNKFTDWNIKNLSELSEGQISVLNKNWNTKIIPKINEYIKENILQSEIFNEYITETQNIDEYEKKYNIPKNSDMQEENDPSSTGQITLEQKREIKKKLIEKKIKTENFLESFGLSDWNEITRDGAENILRDFEGFTNELLNS